MKHSISGAVQSEDTWCWEQSSSDVDVGTEDVKGVVFVQKGFWVNLISTHDVNAHLTHSDVSSVDLKIKVNSFWMCLNTRKLKPAWLIDFFYSPELQKGSQRICVEYPGTHELKFVNSCISFGSSSIKIDTKSPSVSFHSYATWLIYHYASGIVCFWTQKLDENGLLNCLGVLCVCSLFT